MPANGPRLRLCCCRLRPRICVLLAARQRWLRLWISSFQRRCSECRVLSTSSKGCARAACRSTGSSAHCARITHRLSLRVAAPLEGLGSNPAVEDLPHGPGGRCRRRDRRRRRCCRHHCCCCGVSLVGRFGGPFFGRFMARLCAFLML